MKAKAKAKVKKTSQVHPIAPLLVNLERDLKQLMSDLVDEEDSFFFQKAFKQEIKDISMPHDTEMGIEDDWNHKSHEEKVEPMIEALVHQIDRVNQSID